MDHITVKISTHLLFLAFTGNHEGRQSGLAVFIIIFVESASSWTHAVLVSVSSRTALTR